MADWKYDVIIIGAGPAGVTAAIALARAGVPVLAIEAGAFAGAENWSGAVYFGENLAHPEVLGEEGLKSAAWERPVTKRGFFLYNGHTLAGLSFHHADAYRHCYTVLRPTFDQYLAEVARSLGAMVLTDTTATGLVRDERRRVIGVHTNRGMVYADVVFLAEGDASHLVSKEGYERCREPGAPHFLQGIKEVVEVDPARIEQVFGLPAGQGAAFEILLRNGRLHHRTARLNMGGFVYTNRSSVSLGLVMPVENLAREFGGDHNRLMEWFKALPEIRRLINGGRSVAYGAKIIRGGGYRELPQLVDDGLAIGGAASGIGLDFPYPNFTGPATAMGRWLAQAVVEIRRGGGGFTRMALEEHYEQRVRDSHYFRNVEFLESWPRYVEHTRVFFGRATDLACGSLHIAGHPQLHSGQKLWQLAAFARQTAPPGRWLELIRDFQQQWRALGLNRCQRGADGSPPVGAGGGAVTMTCQVDGVVWTPSLPVLGGLWKRLPGILAEAAEHLYRNDTTPLPVKLRRAMKSARRKMRVTDYAGLVGLGLAVGVLMPAQWVCELIKLVVTRPSPEKFLSGFFQRTRSVVRERFNLDADAVRVGQSWEEKLSLVRYESGLGSHIKVYRPEQFGQRGLLVKSALWHVCPAKVYECATDDLGQAQVVVNFENCVKCETCWRAAPQDVDWARQGGHGVVYAAPTASNRAVLALMNKPVTLAPALPVRLGPGRELAPGEEWLAARLRSFCIAAHEGPRYWDAGHVRWLRHLVERAGAARSALANLGHEELFGRLQAHARRRRFFWAESDARQLLALLGAGESGNGAVCEEETSSVEPELHRLFSKLAIKELEHGRALTDEQWAWLKGLTPTPAVLRALGRVDVSLAMLVSGLAYAQVSARPELADIPWIGLNTARRHGREFPIRVLPDRAAAARAVAAMVLGAGEMLLERCRQHAVNRVQFPGLFKDEDGHDGIIKFGAVKEMLGVMEAHVYWLRQAAGMKDGWERVADRVREVFGPGPGSLTYNAGQIIGGSAYSEDDIFSKYYRDSAALRYWWDDVGEDVSHNTGLVFEGGPATEWEHEVRKLVVSLPGASRSGQKEAYRDLGMRMMADGYVLERPLASPPVFRYRDELEREGSYDYGDFLTQPFDAGRWRFTPEMLHADEELKGYHDRLQRYFTETFWNRRFEGLPYHRWVEKLHQVPLEDVREMVRLGFTRMYVPKEFGGEGLLKAHYYILCPLSMRYADPSYALTIMAHSSIGTTPILIGLQQDLPRARSDLESFLADAGLVDGIRGEMARMLAMVESPEVLKVKGVFEALGAKVKEVFGRRPMTRAVASDFLVRFTEAGRAGLRMDLAGFKRELRAAMDGLDGVRERAELMIGELDRRAEAHRLYLRLISAGQISAFALTEPSAGSDSGGIQTRAVLKRVAVLTDADGEKYFMAQGRKRFLLDAGGVDVAGIDYSGYNFEKQTGLRRYRGRPFHDLGWIRRDESGEYYEYYEVNGAKMWITNGHVAGVFCLYARTAEGPTGLMVDRYAEGLVVGRDEEKMGQRGSPTNELGLTNVRVPRENVIGIEGRGQVNALETLNVGRMGLCVSAVAMMAKVLEQTREFARTRGMEQDERVADALGAMAAELYGIESLAYELVGRSDHHGTKSVRTESAIGKYHASEALHRVLALAEAVFGFEGGTQMHELEKHRRDARVLNIYEGTNEVQRFLILRDLVDRVLPQVRELPEPEPSGDVLSDAKMLLRRDLKRAVDDFGAQVWQNPNFQPVMFKLADMAGWIKTMDAALWRNAWVRAHTGADDAAHREQSQQASEAHARLARSEVDRLHDGFGRDLALLKQGLYPASVRVAMLSAQSEEERPGREWHAPVAHELSRPARVVVALEAGPVISPVPRVVDGELLETEFGWGESGDAALAEAVRLRGATGHVSVVAVGPRCAEELLRKALALGADDALLVAVRDLPVDAHEVARLMAGQMAMRMMPVDVVLSGDGVWGTVLAAKLGLACVTGVTSVSARQEMVEARVGAGSKPVMAAMPVVVAMAPGGATREWSVSDFFGALSKPLTVVDGEQMAAGYPVEARYELPSARVSEPVIEPTPEAVARLIRKLTGVESAVGGDAGEVYAGVIELAGRERVPAKKAAVYIGAEGRLEGFAMAREVAESLMLPLQVVMVGGFDEAKMRFLAGRLRGAAGWFVTHPRLRGEAGSSDMVAVLQMLWKDTLPDVLMADDVWNEAVARFAASFPRVQTRYGVVAVERQQGRVALSAPVSGGKLRRVMTVAGVTTHPLVMTIARGAESGLAVGKDAVMGPIYHVPLEMEWAGQEPAGKAETAVEKVRAGVLSEAPVIIDVGYAIRNRENFEAVILPLKRVLEEMGVKGVMVGGTRKVVEELKLLGAEQQIGQTGTAVSPVLMISIGVSGAPQHMDYIGPGATIVAINKDPEAPIMTWNQRKSRPRVVGLAGDLFEITPALVRCLKG